MAKLIIKYQNDYIVERDKNKYKLIDVPSYKSNQYKLGPKLLGLN